jgi:signal transduction histidine kinase
MLGLGLVVATMVLLLGGTVRGLLSYYLDMNSLRVKTSQLRLAEDFKAAVSDIARLAERLQLSKGDDLPEPRPLPGDNELEAANGLPPLPGEASNDPPREKQKPATLREAIERANKKLDAYEASLQDSGSHDPHATGNEHALHLVQKLREAFRTLRRSLDEREQPKKFDGGMFMTMGDKDVDADRQKKRARQMAGIERDADDLCDVIHMDMHQRIDRSRRNYQVTLWIAVPASIVGLFLVCGVLISFYAWVFYPIRDLGAGVARVAKGDFKQRIEVHSGDEMEDLGAAFNDMMQRLEDFYSDLARQVNERSRQLVTSERLASVGFLAAGVAHEINNPLASIAFCSEAMERRLGDLLRHFRGGESLHEDQEAFSKYLKMIQEEAFRCKNITEKLLAFSRPGERRREPTDLRELVQTVLDVTQHLPNHRGKEITFEMSAERLADGSPLTVPVNSEEIKSVVLNLVVNALDSMDEGGRLTIRLSQRADMAELQFTDTGCGMTAEVLENIFEPFYTRSRTGKGTGLGLTISHRIITQHGGEIEASSAGANQGSTFTVRLPLKPPEETPAPSDEPAVLRMPQTRAA